jgi:predicted DCC family thiol-disulfide oxidoreductase YuxK
MAIENDNTSAAGLTVYYDGACPLCQREIRAYKAMPGAEQMQWQDVAEGPEQIAPDLQRGEALARMHVRKADGTLVSGAEAFAMMWQVFPKTRWLGKLAATRPSLWILEPAYRGFLWLRPLWRKQGSKAC